MNLVFMHGCVDGFSRRVMWLRIYSTNRDPWIVAKYFYDVVSELLGTVMKK